MDRLKILILGDQEKAPFHPLERVKKGITESLSYEDTAEIKFTTDYADQSVTDLKKYHVVISYLDNYMELNGFDNILVKYIKDGGKVLALHNGIITPEKSELEQIYGGRFITHPPYCLLKFIVEDKTWLEKREFYMEEEPYMISGHEKNKDVFLWYEYQGEKYEAGWHKTVGKGKIMYLEPGHDQRTVENSDFQSLLRTCVQYLAK